MHSIKHIIKMSKKVSSASTLNIVEKYSFRSRRKVENTESVEVELEPKLPKIKKTNVETVQKGKKKTSKGSKKESGKNNEKLVEENGNEIDVEDSDKLVRDKTNDAVKWFPENWEEVLKNIREMRKNGDAPVDTMGCHKTMDENAPPKVKRYQALVSLMLSSQTRDQETFAAMQKLLEHGLTVENILKTEESTISELIKNVGFYKRKAKYVKESTEILKEEYDGDIPDTVEKLMKLPGVGPKMAHLCMTTAWGKVHGIGVDTHVHRISNRLHWVKKTTNTPEQTRIALESWLPPALWFEVNHLMVGFGQQICLPVNPKCGDCLNKNICPVGRSGGVKKTKK